MNLQFFLEKLQGSDEYAKFFQEHPKSYLCSCFFVLDVAGKGVGNQYHLDYYDREGEKPWWSFRLEDGVQLVPFERAELTDTKEVDPHPLEGKSSVEFSHIHELIQARMEEESIDKKIQKIMLVLQHLDGKEVYFATIFISGMGLIKAHLVDEGEGVATITHFEKKSLFDFVKRGVRD